MIKATAFAKIPVYRYKGGWDLYSYRTAKKWESLGNVSKFWENNGQEKITWIVNLNQKGGRNLYTKNTL